ncbi:MAG: InlB B-repeat-containing protein [Clostridia bacterium]|nr:InlB B-repeat-containing protein [Clostridia bacterium]
MRKIVSIMLIFMTMFLGIGYAALSDTLSFGGDATIAAPSYDVFISHVTPSSSGGAEVTGYFSTVMSLKVTTSRTATFTVTVVNQSDKTYIYERVIDGKELGIDGAYTGSDITNSVSGISYLTELAPGGSLTFDLTVTNPKGITTDNFYLKFNFIEKTGTEILPGNDEFKVIFKYGNGQPDTSVSLHENEFVPRPENPTRSGYEFIGWYTDSSYNTAWNFEVDRVKADTTLYAGWKAVVHPDPVPTEYSVIFKPGNGDPDGTIIVPAGELLPIPTSPTMEGYTFIGWYTDAECTRPWNFDTDRVREKMTLYGGWEIYVPPVPPDCNITFKAGNGDPDRTIIVLTGEFIPRPDVPTREGYVFNGWYIDESYTTAWNFEANRVDGHMTLYGGWTEEIIPDEPDEYTVTFNANNGTSNTQITVIEGSLVQRPALPVKEGYTFIGWYTDSACTKAWNFDTDRPSSDMTLYGGWEKTAATNPDGYHSDFMGLVEALLSEENNCLNHVDLIYDAVMESLTSKKRPKEDAPILHCGVNSVSGGTMSAIASFANSNLTKELQFIFEVDPDPAYRETRLRLYMYYESDIDNAKTGDQILVYQQIISRDSNGVWYADGTYIGQATVGYFFGGGNSGKDVFTINPYTWVAGGVTSPL